DAHARQVEPLAQGRDLRREEAEVLGDELGLPESIEERAEERVARSGAKAAAPSVGGAGGDREVAHEADEVVEAKGVEAVDRGSNSLDPPAKAGARERVPSIQRVSPELSGSAEVVGRDAGH